MSDTGRHQLGIRRPRADWHPQPRDMRGCHSSSSGRGSREPAPSESLTALLFIDYRHGMRILFATLVVALLPGCAEYVSIKSYPAGAQAYVDGVLIGSTPAETSIPRSQVGDPHTWRVEFRNCDFAEGNLETGIAGGRVTGYIFTAGILAI